jgi:hypothetical protein
MDLGERAGLDACGRFSEGYAYRGAVLAQTGLSTCTAGYETHAADVRGRLLGL